MLTAKEKDPVGWGFAVRVGAGAGLKGRQELPREREEKDIPGEAQATGHAEAGTDTVQEEQGLSLGLSCLGRHWPRGRWGFLVSEG